MLVNEVRRIAKDLGVKTTRIKKADMIKLIQQQEGNYACFGSAEGGFCDQEQCLWREDCLPVSVKQTS